MNREEALKIKAHRACEERWDCTICHGADSHVADGFLEACNQLEPKIKAAEKMEKAIALFLSSHEVVCKKEDCGEMGIDLMNFALAEWGGVK